MRTIDEPITVGERYAKAARSGNLSPIVERKTDLDVLIAAGLAAQANPNAMMALKVLRMVDSGELGEFFPVVGHYESLLSQYLSRKNRRAMNQKERTALVVAVINWKMFGTCDYCGGVGRSIVEGTAGTMGGVCAGCHGSGLKPLSRAVPHNFARHALWLSDHIDENSRSAIKRMRALLRQE